MPQRREMMEAWGAFCGRSPDQPHQPKRREPPAGNVIKIRMAKMRMAKA
jgi:hypothetical protein